MDIVPDLFVTAQVPVQLPPKLFTLFIRYLDAECFTLLAYILYRTYNRNVFTFDISLHELHEATSLSEPSIIRCLANPTFRRIVTTELDTVTDAVVLLHITVIEDPTVALSFGGQEARDVLQHLEALKPDRSIPTRDKDTCQYCGVANPARHEIDHVIPRSRGGSGAAYNLVFACYTCNQRKRARVWIPRNLDIITADHPEHRARVLALAVPHE